MQKRGRKASAELEVAKVALTATARPDAPYDLNQKEADVWRGIVDGLPADWITPGSSPVLAAYCRATVSARRLGMLIAQEEAAADYDVDRHLAFIKAHSQNATTIKTLATSLRLTPQSRYTPQRAGTAAGGYSGGKRPWET